jgi:hypothetical protein
MNKAAALSRMATSIGMLSFGLLMMIICGGTGCVAVVFTLSKVAAAGLHMRDSAYDAAHTFSHVFDTFKTSMVEASSFLEQDGLVQRVLPVFNALTKATENGKLSCDAVFDERPPARGSEI